MEKRTIFCTGCDREVQVVLRDGHEAASPQPELAGAVCMDAGWRCTGAACPICAARASGGAAAEEREGPAVA